MNHSVRKLLVYCALALVLECPAVKAQHRFNERIQVPPVPVDLQVPAGHTPYLLGHAEGTQNYVCLPTSTGFAWTFVAPQATLFVSFRWMQSELRQQITTHFLSPNPDEANRPRPTWQSSLDTSAVWGKAVATSSDPSYVQAGAIPWLKLEVAGRKAGPTGGNMLTETTFIQRLNTAGGVAPSTGCSESANVGSTALVPYATDYFFYRASN